MRISTTTLESFRLFCDPEQEWMSEDALLATIRGEFTPTPQIKLGLAFGKVLETPEAFRVSGGYRCGDYAFDDATMAPALALMDYRLGVFEAKGSRVYDGHTVVAKADQLVGVHLKEHKTTTGYFDFDKYSASCQWRLMLDIFEARKATYHVFLLDDHENGVATLRGIESFDLYPYLGLHADCADLVRRFADYVTVRGLDGLLTARQQKAEASWAA